MSKLQIQIPADIHRFAQLMDKLGYSLGPMKACRTQENLFDIWYTDGDISRGFAHLVEGVAQVYRGCPRRIFLNVKIQLFGKKEWHVITDDEYIEAGLQVPWEYDGPSHFGVKFDHDACEALFWDCGANRVEDAEPKPYYRFKPGHREQVAAMLQAEIDAFNHASHSPA